MTTLKRKICVVCATPLSIHFFFRDYLTRLSDDFDVTLVTNLHNDSFTPNLDLPIKIVSKRIDRKINFLQDIYFLSWLIFFFISNRFHLVWGIGPKVGFISMLAAKIALISKRLFIFQGEVWASCAGLKRSIFKFVDRLTAELATNVLCVGHCERDFLLQERVVKNHKAEVINSGSICGVNTAIFNNQTFDKVELRLARGIPVNATVYLYIGRINRDKGVIDLVEAFKLALAYDPTIFLLLIGPDEEGLSSHIKVSLAGLEKHYLIDGFSAHPEEVFALADIFCLPSYREGFPVSLLEAGAMGLACVASNIYGNRNILNHLNAWLHDAGDIQCLSEGLIYMSENPGGRQSMAQALKNEVVNKYEQQSVMTSYMSYIHGLMKAPQ